MAPENNLGNTRLEKKKILFLVTQSKYGGAQRYVLRLAEHFAARNTVIIAVGEKNNQDPLFFDEAKRLGITTIVLDHLIRDISLVKAFDAIVEMRKLLVKERPDFLHVNSSMAGALGSCAAWLYNLDPLHTAIRVIYTVHGFVFNEPLPAWRKKMYIMIEKVTAGWKGALITVSQYDKDQGLANRIAPEPRMVVIHSGIAADEVNFYSREEARQKLGVAEGQFTVGAVGSLYPTKGYDGLIDAFAEVVRTQPQTQLIIIGEGPERQHIEQSIQEHSLSDRVRLCGAVPNAARYLKAFDMLVLSSVKEGLPFVLLEAGLAELPVVATRVGGIPEIITDGVEGILIDPENLSGLSASITSLAHDAERRARLARALRKKILTSFTIESMLEKTERVYLRFYGR
ncbi:MAG: glycosyltransferase [Patescibacteria group bacterium]